MNNKKYRPLKIVLIMLIVTLIPVAEYIAFDFELGKRIFLIVGASFFALLTLYFVTNYIQFEENEVFVKHGLSSFKKVNGKRYTTKHLLHSDIENIVTNYPNKYVIVSLKNGVNLPISLVGYSRSRSDEMLKEFDKINDKIHSEQEN